jgi:hypothetical protein
MALFFSLPVIFSFLLVAAHFFRAGQTAGVVAALFVPFLLLVPRRWVACALQAALLLAAAEWVMTLVWMVRERQALGEPATRLALILGVVAVFTAASAAVFFVPVMRSRYR